MPSIQITDRLGATVDVTPAPTSSLLKYAKALPTMILKGEDISRLQALTLSDPAIRSLQPGLKFNQPVSLGEDALALKISGDAAASFGVTSGGDSGSTLFSPDEFGESVDIPAGRCYVSVGIKADAGVDAQAEGGPASFGVDAGAGMAITSYTAFSAGADAPAILDALKQCIGGFVIPSDADDLKALAAGTIVTIAGRGRLRLSGTANLLAVANPLATLALPGPVPALSVKRGASVDVGASWELSTEYEVRVRKLDARRVQLGWYRKRESEVTVTASADAGITAGLKDTDLFPRLIGAISSDAQADLEELAKAGLPDDEAGTIADAVKAGVDRKLQLGLAAEFGSLRSGEAAFLYEVDLNAMDGASAEAIQAALRGRLGALTGAARLPPGVTELRSILTKANASRFSLKVNLLGIFNFASISKLALSGTVTFSPSTGDLVIADEATASRIQSAAINFGADEDKLRHVMAESFLITAAYRGSRSVISPPKLASSHMFFRVDDRTSRDELRRFAAIAPALSLAAPNIPAATAEFGRTSVFAEARYDDAQAHALFVRPDGTPRPHGDYETAGRRAVALLVPPDGDDAFRLRPATEDGLWNRMKSLGPANFGQLFQPLPAAVIGADYLAIQWWADTMSTTGEILAQMDRGLAAPAAGAVDPAFQKLRQDLARHLRDVAAKAHAQFGAPWGLVAMFLVSGKSETALHITGPRFVYTAARPLSAAG